MSGTRNTGAMTVYWKEQAKQPSFWKEVPIHGKATREKPLFKDDLMQLFLTEEAIVEAKKLDPKLALAIAVRHKFFSKEMSSTVKSKQVRQVVLLGSGYDTRAERKKKYSDQHGVKFYEVDQADVLAKKADIYRNNGISTNAIHVGMDYIKEDLITYLQQNGCQLNQPTHFIWEGNTFYLTPAEIEQTLLSIKHAFTAPVFISFDYMQKALSKVPEVQHLKTNLEKSDAAMKSEVGDFRQEITEKLGFTIVTHKACSDMTKEYGVGETPYASQENYFLCTLRK